MTWTYFILFRKDFDSDLRPSVFGLRHLAFGQYKSYTFWPEKSCEACREDDKVRILNMPLAGMIAVALGKGATIGGIIQGKIEELLEQEDHEYHDELFAEIVVSDFLFKGIKTGAAGFAITYALLADRLPPVFSEENGFALFNGKQNTSENECYEVDTSQAGWDKHTLISRYGRDQQSLAPDLSQARTCTWTGKARTQSRLRSNLQFHVKDRTASRGGPWLTRRAGPDPAVPATFSAERTASSFRHLSTASSGRSCGSSTRCPVAPSSCDIQRQEIKHILVYQW